MLKESLLVSQSVLFVSGEIEVISDAFSCFDITTATLRRLDDILFIVQEDSYKELQKRFPNLLNVIIIKLLSLLALVLDDFLNLFR